MYCIQMLVPSSYESRAGYSASAYAGTIATSPYTPYLFIANAGTVLAVFPTHAESTPSPTASTTPEASYPIVDGSTGCSRYLPAPK